MNDKLPYSSGTYWQCFIALMFALASIGSLASHLDFFPLESISGSKSYVLLLLLIV
jgi:hypothetical protein